MTRDDDRWPSSSWEKRNPRYSTLVVPLGKQEEVLDDRAHGLRVCRAVEQALRGGSVSPQSRLRKVHSPRGGVLLHIAADVCELHGDAKVDRVELWDSAADLEYRAHHQPDSSGNAVTIAKKIPVRSEPNFSKIRLKPDDELSNDTEVDRGNPAEVTEPEELVRPVFWVAPGQLGLKGCTELVQFFAERFTPLLIRKIIHLTAKEVQGRHSTALSIAKERRTPTKRTRVELERRPLVVRVGVLR